MKKILAMSLIALLVGCGKAPMPLPESQSAPSYSVDLTVTKTKNELTPVSNPVASPQAVLDQFQALAKVGTVIDRVDTLTAEEAPSYATQAKPEWSQGRADEVAQEWASDAQQLYIGWGFNKYSLFGTSRHAYYSKIKDRLLIVDYNWLGVKKHQTETISPVFKSAADLLNASTDSHLYDCKKCYRIAKEHGYQNSVKTCRAFMLSLPLFGAYWVFLDGSDKPQMLVNASTGSTATSGFVFDTSCFLFSFIL